MTITWQEAREAVHRLLAPDHRDTPWTVADYGAQDSVAFQVVHGHPDALAGRRRPAVGGTEGDALTLVDKADGRVSFVPWLAGGFARVARMERFGKWPA